MKKTGKTVKCILFGILTVWALWAAASVTYFVYTGGQELCPTLTPYIYGAGALELAASGAIAIAKWVTPLPDDDNASPTLDQALPYAEPTLAQSDPTAAAQAEMLNTLKSIKRRLTLLENQTKKEGKS